MAPIAFLLLAAAASLTSPAPDKVSVTVYRDPDRSAGQAMELEWLEGYALISEKRTIDLPEGEAVIRFEGVAGGILPESAILTGLPDGVAEKNQDADLLSPRALLSAATGRRVTVRRTSRATGAVDREEAVLRSGPDGAAVLQTRSGFEALRCSGLNEALVYDSVPAGLSAKPTLSVRTVGKAASRVTVTLSYLANGFDWQANYVAQVAEDNRAVDLFAWVTLASGDETSFPDADTQVVAGKPNREADGDGPDSDTPYLSLRCWPAGRTDQVPSLEPPPPPPPAFAPMARGVFAEVGDDIIVTASRVAQQEDLGDLKLYRIPQPATVASHSQKQVTMLDRKRVPATILYRSRIRYGDVSSPRIVLKLSNREQDGLGLPLPAGLVAVFQQAGGRPMLLGEGKVEDKAIGEDVEIDVADAPNVTIETGEDEVKDRVWKRTLTVRNANPRPVAFEAEFTPGPQARLGKFSRRTIRRNGTIVWATTIAANGTAVFDYRSETLED